MFLQEEPLPVTHSGGLDEVSVPAEDGGMDVTPERVSSPIIKPVKSIKAGQKAPVEAIKSWKENGFSRFEFNLGCILFFHT